MNFIVIPFCRWYAKRATKNGDPATAEKLWALAFARGDTGLETRRALAYLLLQRGEFKGALSVLSAGGGTPANDPAFNAQLAYAHQGSGNRDEAMRLWSSVVAMKPGGESCYQLGVLHHQMGQLQQAADCYQQAIALDAGHGGAHLNFARLLIGAGQLEAARESIRTAIRLQPDEAAPVCLLGETFAMEGRLDAALAEFGKAIRLDSGFAAAHADTGLALQQLGRHSEAIPSLHKAIDLAPDNVNAWLTLGTSLLQTGQINSAITELKAAQRRFPDHPAVLSSLGACAAHTGNHAEGMQYLEQALAAAPDNADARFNRALLYLREGDYAKGFEEYEWRLRKPELQALIAESPWPLWDGASLKGKTILVRKEQGFGDALQFARFISALVAQGAQVHLETSPLLERVLATAPGVASCSATRPAGKSFDCWCPVMSLPFKLGTTLANLPNTVPYLHVTPDDAARWSSRFANATGLRVGLAWASNPENWVALVKSVSIEQLLPVLHTQNVTFVNLQVGHGMGEFKSLPASAHTIDPAGDIKDFHDTACIISNLDLVITIDSAVAHLAGALGKPVWLLLHHSPDWRWDTKGEASAWYPTARLFRQSSAGDWTTPVEAVRRALEDMAAGHTR
jgi:tetratricopeptide (TPR) repeat protein